MSGNSGILSAYEKMLQDGSANRPIRITQPSPDNPNGNAYGANVDPLEEAKGDNPLGNKIVEEHSNNEDDFFKKRMEHYVEEKKKLINNSDDSVLKEMKKLSTRLSNIEQALAMIMEGQLKLLKENK